MMYLTRRERFSAAHRLFRPEWTDEQNTSVFGGCANPNWHGHNYELFVTVKGNIDPETGFVINLKALSKIIQAEVIDKLDHANINLDVDFMSGKLASTEVLTKAIWGVLEPQINVLNAKLHCVKVIETENNTVKYYGE